ncbi:MAG: hypothetical protein VX733_09930 [Candidatus Latescibacterota bacterium]|nr:hypothetical protein [Candidatus Latescibacterota bacterium]
MIAQSPRPLDSLYNGEMPAVVVKGVFNPSQCRRLMERFEERGYFDREMVDVETQLSGGPYLDLGTSLGRLGANPDEFFAHAESTHALLAHLFDGLENPVQALYRTLKELAPGKGVQTAVEADGRRYGPAIFRMHGAQEGHQAHYDSVARRSKRPDYVVATYQRQFAALLCLQRSEEEGEPFIYQCFVDADVEEVLQEEGTWENYARQRGIARTQVRLQPGDLYLFCTEYVHELPPIAGDALRVVLAVFCATSPDREELVVWS